MRPLPPLLAPSVSSSSAVSFSAENLKSSRGSISHLFWAHSVRHSCMLLIKVDALGHFFHADYSFLSTKYELGRVVRIILTLAPIFYSLALFSLHRKTRNRQTVRSAMVFSSLAGIHVLYCLIAAFGDGAVLFYTEQKWGEMDVAKHLA